VEFIIGSGGDVSRKTPAIGEDNSNVYTLQFVSEC
jgi:hypothetical protein